MADLKTSQFGTITASQANAAGTEGFFPYVDPSQIDPDLRNKRMTRTEAKKFFGLDTFTALSGTAWDGTNKTLTLTSNTALTFSSTKRNGMLRVKQDGTGSHTLSINGVSVPVASGADTITVISYFYDDVAGVYVFSYDTNILGNVGGEPSLPEILSMTAIDATTIRIAFDQSMTVTTAGWSFKKNGTNNPVTGGSSPAPATYDFTVTNAMISTDTILGSYDASTGSTVNGASVELASFTDSAVTNSVGGSYDADAQALFDAIESDSSISSANKTKVNTLIAGWKPIIPFADTYALYPLTAGSEAGKRWNAVNPADTDGAFRLSFVGSNDNTTNNGIIFQFGSGRANMHLQGLAGDNVAYVLYISGSNGDNATAHIGAASNQEEFYAYTLDGGNYHSEVFQMGSNNVSGGNSGTVIANVTGCYIMTSNGTSIKIYKDGTEIWDSGASAGASMAASDLFLNIAFNIDHKFHFAAVTKALTPTQVADITTLITNYATSF